jgi:hypothetical protein
MSSQPPKRSAPAEESDPDVDALRVYDSRREGPGRRQEDHEIRALYNNATARRIVGWGAAALLSIASYLGGYVKARGEEINTLRADNMRLFQQTMTDDMKERLYRLEAKDRITGEAVQMMNSKINEILAEVKKKGNKR